MAGTITIDTLRDGAGNTGSATDAIKGSARAWVNFNGVTTASIRASYNVSSVTRNGTGDYTVNFSTAMPDANYAIAISAHRTTAAPRDSYCSEGAAKSNFAAQVLTSNSAMAAIDFERINLAVFR